VFAVLVWVALLALLALLLDVVFDTAAPVLCFSRGVLRFFARGDYGDFFGLSTVWRLRLAPRRGRD
jgi:hypothetical protein